MLQHRPSVAVPRTAYRVQPAAIESQANRTHPSHCKRASERPWFHLPRWHRESWVTVASHSGLRRECHALLYEGAQGRFYGKSAPHLECDVVVRRWPDGASGGGACPRGPRSASRFRGLRLCAQGSQLSSKGSSPSGEPRSRPARPRASPLRLWPVCQS